MVYSNDAVKRGRTNLPLPPAFLSWMPDATYQPRNGWTYPDDPKVGKVRHHDSLYTAKRYMSRNLGGYSIFQCDWEIWEYDFEAGKYKKIYAGKKGDKKTQNLMFKTVVRKGNNNSGADVDEDELADVMAAIQRAGEQKDVILQAAEKYL